MNNTTFIIYPELYLINSNLRHYSYFLFLRKDYIMISKEEYIKIKFLIESKIFESSYFKIYCNKLYPYQNYRRDLFYLFPISSFNHIIYGFKPLVEEFRKRR